LPTLQPNSNHCFICGVENPVGLKLTFYETAPGEVTANLVLPAHYQGYPGMAHGGIVAAMLDEVAGRAFMGSPEQPNFMYTAKLEVRYRQHVPVEKPLRLVGRVGKRRHRLSTAYGALYDESGTLLAECDSLLVDVPEEVLQQVDLEALGWKVQE